MSNPRCQGPECSKELKRESIAAFFKPGGELASKELSSNAACGLAAAGVHVHACVQLSCSSEVSQLHTFCMAACRWQSAGGLTFSAAAVIAHPGFKASDLLQLPC